jgi:asparagine synthase (glutamine-hydrolysing)
MCGIAGVVGIKDQEQSRVVIERMTNRMSHRGPDADGFCVDHGVALGHRRLSIIDLSEAANQPQFDSSNRYAIILNGEIYNFRTAPNPTPKQSSPHTPSTDPIAYRS